MSGSGSNVSSTSHIILDYVVPAFGAFIANLMYVAPAPAVIGIRSRMARMAGPDVHSLPLMAVSAAATPRVMSEVTTNQVDATSAARVSSLGVDAETSGRVVSATPRSLTPLPLAAVQLADEESPYLISAATGVPILPAHPASPVNAADRAVASASALLHDTVMGAVNPFPYPLMCANTLGWISYSFVEGDYFIFWANVPGCVLTLVYTLTAYAGMAVDAFWVRTTAFSSLQPPPALLRAAATASLNSLSSRAPLSSGPTSPACTPVTTASGAFWPWNQMRRRRVAATAARNDNADEERPATSSEAPMTTAYAPAWLPASSPPPSCWSGVRSPWSRWPIRSRFETLVVVLASMLVLSAFFVFIPLAPTGALANQNARVLLSGVVANINQAMMYASPLLVVRSVLRRRDATEIDPLIALMSSVNGVLWTAYGVAKHEPFVYALNSFGSLMGAIQCALILIFGRGRQAAKMKSSEVKHAGRSESSGSSLESVVPAENGSGAMAGVSVASA